MIARAAALLLFARAAGASTVVGDREEIDFDRPEAWAMKWFASAAQPTFLGGPLSARPGSFRLALEAEWIPHLDADERRVGFDGTAEEDLNKTPIGGRLRATVGLPGRFTLTGGYTPPIPINGMRAQDGFLALQRPILDVGRFTLGARAWGMIGRARGDFTCSSEVASAGSDASRNPLGCAAPSHDLFTFRTAGADAVAVVHFGRVEPYVTAGGSYMNTSFQVDALLAQNVVDKTHLHASGGTFSTTGGLRVIATSRLDLVGEAYYSPLTVHRPGDQARLDGLFNVRALMQVRFW